MKTVTLLSRAKALAQTSARTAALSILPISAAVLPSSPAVAQNVIFDPAAPVIGTSGNVDEISGSSTSGSAALPSMNGITGEKSYADAQFEVFSEAPSIVGPRPLASLPSNEALFAISGGAGIGSGEFQPGAIVPVAYDFTLSDIDNTTIGAWTLTFDITAGPSGGSYYTTDVPISGSGAGTFSGTGLISLGNDEPLALDGYGALLEVNASSAGVGTFEVNIPPNSIDFNAVPEPKTWTLLAVGFLAGLVGWRRNRRGKQLEA